MPWAFSLFAKLRKGRCGVNTFNVPSFVLGDAMVDYVWRNYRIAVNVNNLLNQDHYGCFTRSGSDFCSPGAQRTVVGSITYRWRRSHGIAVAFLFRIERGG